MKMGLLCFKMQKPTRHSFSHLFMFYKAYKTLYYT